MSPSSTRGNDGASGCRKSRRVVYFSRCSAMAAVATSPLRRREPRRGAAGGGSAGRDACEANCRRPRSNHATAGATSTRAPQFRGARHDAPRAEPKERPADPPPAPPERRASFFSVARRLAPPARASSLGSREVAPGRSGGGVRVRARSARARRQRRAEAGGRPNLVLVTLDTTRRDHTSIGGLRARHDAAPRAARAGGRALRRRLRAGLEHRPQPRDALHRPLPASRTGCAPTASRSRPIEHPGRAPRPRGLRHRRLHQLVRAHAAVRLRPGLRASGTRTSRSRARPRIPRTGRASEAERRLRPARRRHDRPRDPLARAAQGPAPVLPVRALLRRARALRAARGRAALHARRRGRPRGRRRRVRLGDRTSPTRSSRACSKRSTGSRSRPTRSSR